MCTLNGERFVHQQLHSIAAQSRPPDEIVICDDGSTDSTWEIINRLSRQYPGMIHPYRNSDRLGYARNFGRAISLCQGALIFLSDQDDVWLRNKLESIEAIFTREADCYLVASPAIVTDQHLNPTGTQLSPPATRLDKKYPFGARCQGSFAYGCTLAFRSSLSRFILPISGTWGHDNWICFIASLFSRIRTTPEPLMLYRRHSCSAGSHERLDSRGLREVLTASKKSTREDYKIDREQWRDMYLHLQAIFSSSSQAGILGLSPEEKIEVLNEVRARFDFSNRRLEVTAIPRILRLPAAVRMLCGGEYHEFVSGWRSLAKDLLTA